MASPASAESASQEPGQHAIASNTQSNHQASDENAGATADAVVSTETSSTQPEGPHLRPKSEESAPSFSNIPAEAVADEVISNGYALHYEESGEPGLANDPGPSIASSNDEDVGPASTGSSIPQLADPNPAQPRTVVLKKKLFRTPKERVLEAEEGERRLREAGALFHQSLIKHNPPQQTAPSATSLQPDQTQHGDDVDLFETGQQAVPINLDTDAEDGAAAAVRFKSCKTAYERKKRRGQNTLEDEIAFSKVRNAEEQRLKLGSRKRAYDSVEEDDQLFLAEGTPSVPHDPSAPENDDESLLQPGRRKHGRPNRIPDSALQDAAQIGWNALEAKDRKRASRKGAPKAPAAKKVPKEPKSRVSKSKDKKTAERGSKSNRGRSAKGPEMTNINSLLNNDIIGAAQRNQGKAAQPGFSSKNKRDALAELIASIPEEERTTHNADKKALDKATKSFSGHASMKADGNNGWRLRGMQTSLYHYQLLGAAFMRDRENATHPPYGGLEADEMGLGKTVTCLANIVDGQASHNSPNRTTLIVCPSGLCSQWLSEIKKHVSPGTFQEVITYRAGARLESADPVKTLSNMDIIITSYSEVMRSYPTCDAPKHLISVEGRSQWWNDHFNANRGVLHRIYFRRILLDEGTFPKLPPMLVYANAWPAQAIKNHASRTSLAVRSLLGKYRWAISGTPIQNGLEEFFPFFSFLKVPHTGSIETFKNNFVGRNKTTDARLQTYLRQIMIRRTHLDTIFGRPLLQLPGITSNTVSVEFNHCERAIYRIVEKRFIAKIRTYARSGPLDKKYQSIFVLYLRLRQLVGHILLVQQTLKDLLEAEDLEKLWRLTGPEVASHSTGGSQDVLSQLRQMLSKAKDGRPAASGEAVHNDPSDGLTETVQVKETENSIGGTIGTAFKFRKYLRNLKETGKWQQTIDRSLCYKCGGVPDDPHVTSCFHVYCKECIQDMLFALSKTDQEKAFCLACEAEFECCEPCRGFDEASDMVNSFGDGPERRPRKSTDSDENDFDWLSLGGCVLPSAKTLAVKAQIQNWVEEDSEAKIIVFTQFRPMIRILARIMQEQGWGWSQFHGGMSFAARDKALKDFAEKKETKVLLASLKAGGVGLNLTMASKVIIIDLWWNESVEQQAFCRCFRIGQTRPVDICRIGMLTPEGLPTFADD